MQKYLTVIASFIIMLCLGGVYAWSIIASELIEIHKFSATQAQIIFGTIIAIFPTTMVFTGKLAKRIKSRYLGYISGVLFFLGYLLGGYSYGNFYMVLLGIGVLAGIGTGFGYWVSLTVPVQWFPERKGLITGIAAAGFGLGAVVLSNISETILMSGKDVLQLLIIIGVSYGLIVFLFSNLIFQKSTTTVTKAIKLSDFIFSGTFRRLVLGIFLGTFAGLLIIGSLKIIGEQSSVSNHVLILGVSFFAVANFLGRLSWGFLSDRFEAGLCIFLALAIQSAAILALNLVPLNNISYLILSVLIGFGFGSNFVLFAKESAHVFGVSNLGIVYPYVFLGYAVAGISGPLSGGIMFDFFENYTHAIFLASLMSLSGSLLFLFHYIKIRKAKHEPGNKC